MATPIRALIVEDYADDALLIVRELRRGGYEPSYVRVETEGALRVALDEGAWDVILSDYSLPGFTGLDALRVVQERGVDIPFILISGIMGEDVAVEAMQRGCHDYLMKGRLARLVPAVRREIREARVREARRQAERALRASEERYRTLVERLPAAIYTSALDEASTTTYVSPYVESLTGYPAEAFTADSGLWLERLHPEDRERTLTEVSRCRRTGEPLSIEYRLVRRDGQPVWVRDEASIVRGEDGRPLHLHGVMLDVTRTHEAEEALRQRMEHLSTLYEASRALQETLDTHTMLDRVCHLAVEGFGLRLAWAGLSPDAADDGRLMPYAVAGDPLLADYVGKLSFCLDHGDDHPVCRAAASGTVVVVPDVASDPTFHPSWRPEALAHGICSMAVLPLKRARDVLGVLVAYGHAPEQFEGEDVRTLGALANLAAVGLQRAQLYGAVQRHAEILKEEVRLRTRELQESEARFRAVFEHSAIGIALTDPDGHIVMSNPALQALLDRDAGALQGAEIRGALALPAAPSDRWAIADDGQVERFESAYRRSDGTGGWVELAVSAVHDHEGRPAYYVWLLDDVTEARAAQAALVQAERLTTAGRLAASFVHEIRNPLQSVIGCLGLAREQIAGLQDAAVVACRRYLDVSHEELLRASTLLSTLGDLSRHSEPRERALTDVNALLQRIATLTAKQARDLGVVVTLDLADELPELLLATDSIEQVFLNGALNALDAMPGGGSLRITTERVPGGVRVRLVDTGVGIPPDVLPRLFDSFFTTKEEGLGLGLFVCKGIITRHGGSIHLESAVGEGTTFTVFLPG